MITGIKRFFGLGGDGLRADAEQRTDDALSEARKANAKLLQAVEMELGFGPTLDRLMEANAKVTGRDRNDA